MPDQQKHYMTPQEVAMRFMVSPITVRSWVTRGWLAAELTAGGHRRFLISEVDAFAQRRKPSFARREQTPLRVLIVDDDKQIAHYLSELVTNAPQPAEVATALDGFEAGYKVRQFSPDVVLLDLMMPGVNGFETCRRIKQDPHTASIRVVAMSGFPSLEHREQILAAGAEHCLAKPLDEPALLDLLGLAPAAALSKNQNQVSS